MKRTAFSDKDPLFHVFKQQLSTILWQQRTIWENEHRLKRSQLHDIFNEKKKKISPKPTVKSFSLRIPQNCGHTFLQKVFVFLNYLIWCSNKCITWRKKGEITIHFRNFRKCAWKINQFQKSLFSHLFWISH